MSSGGYFNRPGVHIYLDEEPVLVPLAPRRLRPQQLAVLGVGGFEGGGRHGVDAPPRPRPAHPRRAMVDASFEPKPGLAASSPGGAFASPPSVVGTTPFGAAC